MNSSHECLSSHALHDLFTRTFATLCSGHARLLLGTIHSEGPERSHRSLGKDELIRYRKDKDHQASMTLPDDSLPHVIKSLGKEGGRPRVAVGKTGWLAGSGLPPPRPTPTWGMSAGSRIL